MTAFQSDAFQAGAFQLSGAPATGGGVSYSLTCDAGVYSLTGSDAELLYITSATTTGGYAYERRLRSLTKRNEREAEELALILSAVYEFLA